MIRDWAYLSRKKELLAATGKDEDAGPAPTEKEVGFLRSRMRNLIHHATKLEVRKLHARLEQQDYAREVEKVRVQTMKLNHYEKEERFSTWLTRRRLQG